MKAARVGLLVEDKRADGDLAAMAAAVNADILVFVGEPPSEVILPSVEVYRLPSETLSAAELLLSEEETSRLGLFLSGRLAD